VNVVSRCSVHCRCLCATRRPARRRQNAAVRPRRPPPPPPPTVCRSTRRSAAPRRPATSTVSPQPAPPTSARRTHDVRSVTGECEAFALSLPPDICRWTPTPAPENYLGGHYAGFENTHFYVFAANTPKSIELDCVY